MKAFNNFILIGCLLFFGGLLCAESACLAGEDSIADDLSFELRATIMEVDPANDLMIIAEKEIHLRSYLKDGKKKWKTIFLDDDGEKISVTSFKQYDNVIVKGEKNSLGVMLADEITLLPVDQAVRGKKVKQKPDKTMQPATPVHLEGEVWVN